MKKLIYLLFGLMILTSCLYTKSAATKKFCVPLAIDTVITIHDTIQIPSSSVDTVFLQQHSDTVIVENDSVRVVYIRTGDKISLRGTAKAKTVFVTKTVTLKLTPKCPPQKQPPWWHKYITSLFLVLAFWFIISIGIFVAIFKR